MPKNADGPKGSGWKYGVQAAIRERVPFLASRSAAELNEEQRSKAARKSADEKALSDLIALCPEAEPRRRDLAGRGWGPKDILDIFEADGTAAKAQRRQQLVDVSKARRAAWR